MVSDASEMEDHPRPSEDGPRACPKCGATPMLYTPNARRNPYAEHAVYEPAWQCTRCGHLDFLFAEAPRDSM